MSRWKRSAPSKDRTCDLGFRKTNKTRGVVFPYDGRTTQVSSDPLRLPRVIAESRFHAIAINQLDRAAQVVRIEIGIALRGCEVGVPNEALDGHGPSAASEKLRHEEVPQVVEGPPSAPSALLRALERLVQPRLAPGLTERRDQDG